MQTFQKFRNISQTCTGAVDCSHRFILIITCHPSLVTLITSPDYVWIAESLNLTHDLDVLWYFHQKNMITSITYTIANCYYMHYLAIETESLESLKTKGQKLKTEILMTTLTSQFHQVIK